MYLFNTSILKKAEDDTELSRTIKTSVMGYLIKKYDDPALDDLLDVACLIDSRFKLQYTKEVEKRKHQRESCVGDAEGRERAVVVREEESR